MVKRLFKWTIAAVVSLSLAISPAFMGGAAFASSGDARSVLDGMTVEQAEKDSELSPLLNDPMFYDYFTISDEGVIKLKKENAEADYAFESTDKDSLSTAAVSKIGGAKVPSKYSSKKKYNCIDISYWNCYKDEITAADWEKIKNAGITHVIVRVGYSALKSGEHNKDSYYKSSINGAYKAGLKVGAYYFTTAKTESEAKSEAEYTVKLLKDYKSKITMPVVFDYESNSSGRLTDSVMKNLGKSKCTKICSAYCDVIKKAGYTPMVYANYATLMNRVNYKTLQKKYPIWLAVYTSDGSASSYPGDYCMWQYSSSCKVSGISGNVDINYYFKGVQEELMSGKGSDSGSSDDTGEVKTYKGTTTASMNYRTGPGTNYEKKGTYSKGTTIYMVSRTGDWAKMKNGYYICLSNVKYSAKTTDSVNYRTGPGTSYKIKGTYSKGTSITIVKVKNGWAKMSNGYWLSADYTKMK